MTFTDTELDAIVHVASTGSPCLDAAAAITYLRSRDPIGAAIMRERCDLAAQSVSIPYEDTQVFHDQVCLQIAIVEKIRTLELPTHAEILALSRELLAARTPDDGRPCSMDAFAAELMKDKTVDHYDFREAINHWCYGDWENAMAFLTPKARAALTVSKPKP